MAGIFRFRASVGKSALEGVSFMQSMGDRLRALRKQAGFETAKDAAQKYGWNEGTYRGHEGGSREISRRAAIEYAEAFGVSVKWLLTGQEEKTAGGGEPNETVNRGAGLVLNAIGARAAPIVGPDSFREMADGKFHLLSSKAKGTGIIAGSASDRAFLYEVQDDAMRGAAGDARLPEIPDICRGDSIVVDPAAPLEPGKVVIVGIRETEAVMVRLYGITSNETEDDVDYVFMAKNPMYPKTQKFRKDQVAFRYRVTAVQRQL